MSAVTLVNATADTNAGSATTVNSTSFTPTAGLLLVVCVYAAGTTNVTSSLTASANSMTFTRVKANLGDAGTAAATIFVSDQVVPGSPVAMTVGHVNGTAATGVKITVLGASSMSKTGSTAVKQSVGTDNNLTASSTPAVTFASNITAGNPVIGHVGNNSNPAGLTPPTGYTERSDQGHATPTHGQETATLDSHAGGSATVTWGSTSTRGVTQAVELDTSAANTPKSGTDTAAVSVAETNTLSASSTNTDTAAVSVSETKTLTSSSTSTESIAVSIADVASLQVSQPATDTTAISVSETSSVTILVTLTASDTSAISVSEAATAAVQQAASDTTGLAVSESKTLQVSQPASDTAAIGVTETASITVFVSASDTAALAISEAKTLAVMLSRSDAAVLGIVESIQLGVSLQSFDTLTIALTESSSVDVSTVATNVYVWDGTDWQPATAYVWNGSAWVERTVKVFNGTDFV